MKRFLSAAALCAVLLVANGDSPAQPARTNTSNSVAAASRGAARPAALTTIANPLGVPDLSQYVHPAGTPTQMSSTLQIMLMLTVLSLAPSILVMMTSFTRIIIVLGLLRQALATQTLPPNQVLIGLALFMTFVVMAPVYNQVHDNALQPYLDGKMNQMDALNTSVGYLRTFMIRQIEAGSNTDDVYLFLDPSVAAKGNLTWGDVPTMTLIPSYIVSELKVSFLMGFRIYLPFLVIDMVIASVLISMGMLMLPPVLISLPFKLLLFVLVDGWHLVVGTLMTSFS